jgi:prepilin-type N-terminal cleavage/methylation domain-containing protein/prepilin-type processing-associated H-X9-DG protein
MKTLALGRAHNHAFTLVELLVVIAIIGVLAGLLLSVSNRTKSDGKNAMCISQLRQLGIAARLYAEDNGSRLPVAERLPSLPLHTNKTLPRICDVLDSYVGKASGTNDGAPVFKCPCDLEDYYEVEGSSYMWNVRLNGQRIDFGESVRAFGGRVGIGTNVKTWYLATNLVHSPETTPLFWDYDDFHPRPPESGKNVVFMDGHVAVPRIVSLK